LFRYQPQVLVILVNCGASRTVWDHFPAEHLIVVALFAFVQERTVRVVDGDVGALGVDEGVALEAADAQS
jgi:hypothetical protein